MSRDEDGYEQIVQSQVEPMPNYIYVIITGITMLFVVLIGVLLK